MDWVISSILAFLAVFGTIFILISSFSIAHRVGKKFNMNNDEIQAMGMVVLLLIAITFFITLGIHSHLYPSVDINTIQVESK